MSPWSRWAALPNRLHNPPAVPYLVLQLVQEATPQPFRDARGAQRGTVQRHELVQQPLIQPLGAARCAAPLTRVILHGGRMRTAPPTDRVKRTVRTRGRPGPSDPESAHAR